MANIALLYALLSKNKIVGNQMVADDKLLSGVESPFVSK